jgi:hypothetical protein
MISNHTFSNLVLRLPGHRRHRPRDRRPELKALGDAMASKNDYVTRRRTSSTTRPASTEDWSYWITGGFGYTFEIGDEGFHPAYEEAVVRRVPRLAPADGRRSRRQPRGVLARGCRRPPTATCTRSSAATAPAKHTISVSKTVTSETSPVIQLNGTTGAPLLYTDNLRTDYTSTGGRFDFDVNPSTRPLVMGRYGREPRHRRRGRSR